MRPPARGIGWGLLVLACSAGFTSHLEATPPRLGPAEAGASLDEDFQEIRIDNLQGVARIQFRTALRLRDASGPYLMVQVRVQNTRKIPFEVVPENFLVRVARGDWRAPEGIADQPPLGYLEGAPGDLLRPSRGSRRPLSVPRDRIREIYLSFRGELDPERVDALAQFGGQPYFLRRPVRASQEELTQEALDFASRHQLDMARGLLEEAARTSPRARQELGTALLRAAYRYRRADQPVSEDRILRLALPYAPNPAYAQARLAELRTRLGIPERREGSYHRRRAERYRVVEDGR